MSLEIEHPAWSKIQLPPGTTAQPLAGSDVAALMIKGKKIDHVAAFSPYTGSWCEAAPARASRRRNHIRSSARDLRSTRPVTTFTPSARSREPGECFIWKGMKKPRRRSRQLISRSCKETGSTSSA